MKKQSRNQEKEGLKHEKEYVESLEHFLESSGEDTVVVDGILEQFPNFAYPTLENLRSKGSGCVLDIGSGNGAKAIYLARRLQELGINIVIDSLEPKAEQREGLAKNYRGENQKYFGTVFGQVLSGIQPDKKYDLALAIHSLYEFPRDGDGNIPSLDSLGNIVSDQGAGVIIFEHPEGDFQRMKHEIYPLLGKKLPVSQNGVTKSLEAVGISYKVGNIIECRFSLNAIIRKSEFEIGKAMSFLFSDSLDSPSLTEDDYQTIGRWVKNNVRRDDEENLYLWTPDVSIWTFSRQRKT
jgi:SAM-dependent methyltransferase